MAEITIEYDDREVRAALRRLANAGRDLTPAMRDVASLLEASAQRAFEQELSPGGKPWDDLCEVTKRRRGGPIPCGTSPPAPSWAAPTTWTPISSTRSSAPSVADSPENFVANQAPKRLKTPEMVLQSLFPPKSRGMALTNAVPVGCRAGRCCNHFSAYNRVLDRFSALF